MDVRHHGNCLLKLRIKLDGVTGQSPYLKAKIKRIEEETILDLYLSALGEA